MPARLNKGEIARVRSGDGFVYLQYLGKHPKRGQAVAVCLRRHLKSAKITAAMFEGVRIVFYPLAVDVGRGVATIVGRLPVKLAVPREEAESWDHDLLLSRIAVELDASAAPESESPAEAAPAASVASDVCTVTHYIYCRTEGDALELSAALNDRGFKTAQESSLAGELPWLALATHNVADEEALNDARHGLEALAASCRGEYDGWQAEPGTACLEIRSGSEEAVI